MRQNAQIVTTELSFYPTCEDEHKTNTKAGPKVRAPLRLGLVTKTKPSCGNHDDDRIGTKQATYVVHQSDHTQFKP